MQNSEYFENRPVTLNEHNNLLQIEEHIYQLQDVEKPNAFRNMFPYDEIPKIPFNDRVVPHNMPKEIWITDTTFRDGQQSRAPYSTEQIVTIYDYLHQLGGPNGDSGLTGRKIIVDTYGGYARHGGGAFSGKDCTKVDRSAAYAARYVAKNIVAAGLADKCEIQLSYAIGVAQPTSIMADTFGTGKVSDEKLVEIIRENFDLRPAGIIKMLDLRRPVYKQTAAYGHFGRNDLDLSWEKLDKTEILKKYL